MMHKTISLLAGLASLLLCASAGAQPVVTELYFDTRASFHQEVADGRYFSQFTGDHFNLNVRGSLTDKLGFRIRQRLNKKVFDERNMFNATDFLYLRWQATPRWAFTVGKNAVLIGGYEFDAVPIDVYYYSNFCNNLYQDSPSASMPNTRWPRSRPWASRSATLPSRWVSRTSTPSTSPGRAASRPGGAPS